MSARSTGRMPPQPDTLEPLNTGPSTRGHWQVVLATFVAVVCLVQVLLFDTALISNDGAQYLSIARNMAAGKGSATDAMFYEKHYISGVIPAPQTTFPPGYPLLIAALSHAGLSPVYAGFLIALACFALTPFLLFRTVHERGHSGGLACALAVAWTVLGVNFFVTLDCLSETLYTLLTLVSLHLVVRAGEASSRTRLWLGAGGAAAALAFLVRYSGLFFIFSLGLYFLARCVRHRTRDSVLDLLAVCILPGLAVAGSFLRNYLLVGEFHGGPHVGADNAWLDVIRHTYWALTNTGGLSASGVLGGELAELLLVAAGLVAAAALVRGEIRIESRALRRELGESYVVLSLLYVVLTLGVLGYMAKTTPVGPSMRYLMPIWPFVFLLLAAPCRAISLTRHPAIVAGLALVLLGAAVLAGQREVYRQETARLRQLDRQTPMRAAIEELLQSVSATPTCLDGRDQSPILANESHMLNLLLGRPTIGLTHAPYTTRVWTPGEVKTLVDDYGVACVLFFSEQYDPSSPILANSPFFDSLHEGSPPAWLEPVTATPAVTLYRLRRDDTGGGDGENPL